MRKIFLAGTSTLAIAGATFAYAQSDSAPFERAQHWRPSAEDVAAFADARIAALHAGLKLNADQDKNWPPVEAALRDLAKLRTDRMTARAKAEPERDPIERLAQHAQAVESRGAALKKLADAAGPLYKSLDDAQKRRFMVLAHFGAHRFAHRDRHEWRVGWRHHGPRERMMDHRMMDQPQGDEQPD